MKRWKWRDEQRPYRRQGGWHRGNRHRSTQEQQWYGQDDPSEGRSGHHSASSSSTSSSSTSSSSTANSAAPELPGFYFDPEKNRYFRLLPGHNNCNPLTREQLQEKEREKQRIRMLAEDEKLRKKAPRAGLNTSLLLQKRHLGLLPDNSYCRLVHEVKVSGMRRHKLEIQSTDNSSPNTDNFRVIVGDSACERVFTVNDVSHGGCKYGIMNFSGTSRGSLSVEMCDNVYFTNRKVNSICWASVNYPDSHVLVILKDAETGRTQTYNVSSDVLAQHFARRVPVLFNGCRSGEIFSIDLRQRVRRNQTWKTSQFQQESAITSLRVLQDENYLLAADMMGQIKLWDVRGTKPVQQYKGHYNEHAYLPVHVSEPEGLVLAVGQDCYTRIWSLRDGHLLRTIPSPHPAANDAIPSIVFSSKLGGCRGLPGLLMAVKHDLYYFPYNTDYQEEGEQQQGTLL